MTIEERLEKLEREPGLTKCLNHRLLAVLGLAVVGLGLACVLTSTTPTAQAQGAGSVPKEVRANMFVLENENGKTLAILTVLRGGSMLGMFDQNGMSRGGPIQSKAGPALVLRDENAKDRVLLSVSEAGPMLDLFAENGKAIWKTPSITKPYKILPNAALNPD